MSPSPVTKHTTLPRKRRRTAVSCNTCRQRKVKCNRQSPCDRCIQSRTKCVYADSLRGDGAPRELMEQQSTDSLSPPLSVPDFQLGCSPDTSQSQNEVSLVPIHLPSLGDSARKIKSYMGDRHQISDLTSRVHALEQMFALGLPTPNSYSQNLHPSIGISERTSSVHKGTQLGLNKSRLFGHSHWTHSGQEFAQISNVFMTEPDSSANHDALWEIKSDIKALQQKCKLLAKKTKATRPSRCAPLLEAGILSPSRELSDLFAMLYVTRFESVIRIVHIPSFWREYDSFWDKPSEASISLKLKVQLITAIGSSIYQGHDDIARLRSAQQSVYSAQSWMAGPLEKDRLTIGMLQVQCLLILARQTLSVGADMIWIGMGTIIRTAMQMGLHRDPRHFANLTALQAEMRRRLWASILELNLQAALDSGVPPDMSYCDFDAGTPSNVNDTDIDAHVEALEEQSDSTATDSSLQRLMFQHLRSRLKILHWLNSTGKELSHENVTRLHSHIMEACRNIRSLIPQDGDANVHVFKYNMVDLFLRRFILTLHRPFAGRAHKNLFSSFSRKMYLDSAITLISPLQNEEFSHLMLIGGGIFKNRIIHTSLAIASELIMIAERKSLVGVSEDSMGQKKLLMMALREACSQCIGRMQHGETNVPLYMKLRMVLFLAECLDSGDILQLNLAKNAKSSLEESYIRLQEASGVSVDSSGGDDSNSGASDPGWQSFFQDFDLGDMFEMMSCVVQGKSNLESFSHV